MPEVDRSYTHPSASSLELTTTGRLTARRITRVVGLADEQQTVADSLVSSPGTSPPTCAYLVLVLHDHSIKELILNKLP